ncbi:MAG: hypothetical protein AAGF11_20685 [Myxococcota bacterium]
MDPKPPPGESRLALANSGSAASVQLPGTSTTRTPAYHDDRLVPPETREEIVRGHRLQALPANPEHGDEHTEVTYVIRSHAATGYVVSTDLLTRASDDSDFATDTCVRRGGTDPRTGDRYLEELAFEVVNEQSVGSITERAKALTEQGVRRLIAIFVKKDEICEWSADENRWIPLDLDGELEDPTLVRPVPVRALFDAAKADDSMVDALEAKNNPRLAEIKRKVHEDGRREGLLKAIETACELLDIPVGPQQRAQMLTRDSTGLDALLEYVKTERRWP